ncbi:hypothetical protein PV341_32080 [Streptomyces sp. PA03-1a]|nr:hypothetical protein [Streptomyces sp. PA03-1a]
MEAMTRPLLLLLFAGGTAAGYAAVGAFSLLAVLTHPGAMDWGSAFAWLYVLGMLGHVGMGLVGLALAGPAERWPGNGSLTMEA